jgi:preprotein translocase subunit SecG
MYELILIIHVILAVMLVGLVLLQQGKSGGMGTAFGGATEALLTTPAASNVLSRSTAIIATFFFITSLSLGYLAAQKSRQMHQDLVPSAVIPQPDTALMTVPTEESKQADVVLPEDVISGTTLLESTPQENTPSENTPKIPE